MIELTSHHTQLQALTYLLQAIEAGHATDLVKAGIPALLLDDLRDMKHVDIARLAAQPLGFKLVVNTDKLSHEIRVLKRQLAQQENLEYFAQHGAPISLIQKLFKLNRETAVGLRRAFKSSQMEANASQRASSIGAYERHTIEVAWAKLKQEAMMGESSQQFKSKTLPLDSQIDIWLALHQQFSHLTIASLHTIALNYEKLAHR
jgi:Protein of unknown function (DUF2857)